MSRRPLIGVLGGLGPAATVDFYAKVVELSAQSGAAADQEHVRLIIDADPEVPNRNASIAGSGESSAPALVAKALRLKVAGAEVLAMACNAAHAYQREIEAAAGLKLISIVDEAVRAVERVVPAGSGVGVLAAAGTLDAGLYRVSLSERGFKPLEPEGELRERFMRLLYQVKAGQTGDAQKREMREIAGELITAGAVALVAGCTEVPLVLAPAGTSAGGSADVPVPLIDAGLELAAAVVRVGSRHEL